MLLKHWPFPVFIKGSKQWHHYSSIKLLIFFIAKAAWILAIHLIRAGVLDLHHCLAVDIVPSKGRNWGEESDFYLRFHFSNSHESVWAGCTKILSVSLQVYTLVSHKQSHYTACSILYSLYLARWFISYFIWSSEQTRTYSASSLTDWPALCSWQVGMGNQAGVWYTHWAGREYFCISHLYLAEIGCIFAMSV